MTDRELLELAAKAANIRITWDDQSQTYATCNVHGDMFDDWNPLEDDGDALRLAVKLEMDLSLTEFGAWVNDSIDCTDTDPYAATRMAIVLAAAEIGREK